MVNLWFGNNRKKSEKWFSFFSHFLGSFPHVYSITTCNHVAFVAYYTLSLVSSLHLILCGDWKWNHNLDQAHFYHSWFFLFCFGLVSSNGWMDGWIRKKKSFSLFLYGGVFHLFLYQFNNHIYTTASSYWLQSTIMKREWTVTILERHHILWETETKAEQFSTIFNEKLLLFQWK